MKKNNKRGFTLAELLIVVAIIGVLTAIAIPVFTAQLNNSKYATDLANARSIYAEMTADYLANSGTKNTITGIENVTKGTEKEITTDVNGAKNTYKFSGVVGIKFTKGTTDTTPKVEVDAFNGNKAVTLGGSASGMTEASSDPTNS